jgi:hypothetical protein
MEFLVAVALMAVLLLPAKLLRDIPSSLGVAPERGAWLEPAEDLDDDAGGLDMPGVDDGYMTLQFVRRRLDSLANELAHLDDDPGVLARAFRTTVALTAYEALLAEESRLAQQPLLHVEATFAFEETDATVP